MGIDMKKRLKMAIILVPLLAAALALPARVCAGEPVPVFQEFDLELGAVGRGTTLRDNLHVAPISEQNTDLKYVVSP